MISNKHINFGRYRINTLLTDEVANSIYNKVKEHTSIANLGDGEIVFYIEPYDVPKIIDFEIETITNIKDYIKLSSTEMAQLDDSNLKCSLQFLEKLMIGYLKQIQEESIKQLSTLHIQTKKTD